MNIRHLINFIAVAEDAHFGRAALRLGLAQPALSQSIQRLEREVGVRLFDRTNAGVKLTLSGDAFLLDARAAVTSADRAMARARSAIDEGKAVRVGLVPSAIWGELDRLLRIAKTEGIAVELIDAKTNDQLDALANGSLDMAFVVPPFDAPQRLKVVSIANNPVVAAVPTATAPAGDGPISPIDLAKSLILMPREDGPALHDAIFAMFSTRGLTPTIVQRSPRTLTTLALVSAGMGCGIVSTEVANHISIPGVSFREIDAEDELPRWPLSLAYMPMTAKSNAAILLSSWRRQKERIRL